jgi:hypothetical protein
MVNFLACCRFEAAGLEFLRVSALIQIDGISLNIATQSAFGLCRKRNLDRVRKQNQRQGGLSHYFLVDGIP